MGGGARASPFLFMPISMPARLTLALLLATAGCATAKRTTAPLPPLGDEGEVHVYALPLPREAERLSFTLEAIALVRQDGGEVPLAVSPGEIVGKERRDQRLLASGRVPPGDYVGLAVKAGAATLGHDGERSRLLVPAEPTRLDLRFRVRAGAAVVVWASLDAVASVRGNVEFAPAFTAALAPQTPPQVALYVTNTADANVTAVDRRTRRVSGILPTGAAPRGIALDATAGRAYVALEGEDQVEILDVAAGAPAGRLRLTPGDGPTELALAGNGTLVAVNARSRTVSFLDPLAMAELGRVPVGDDPVALVVDRSGQRAYVANRGSGTISVLDVRNRAVVATLAADPEPIALELNRDGSRLYVLHRASTYLAVFSLPSLAPETRAFLAPGATAIKVDPRSDLLYLARGDERRLVVYEPVSLQPIDTVELPGAAVYLAIDDAENTLDALLPDRRAIAVLDLTSREVRAVIPVGAEPSRFILVGAR